MHKRKLLIGLTIAGLFLAGFGAATMPASAEQRTLLVTLVGGAQVTVTVDVPPGTPVDQIQIPGITAPIQSVQDVSPAQPAAPAPAATTPTTPTKKTEQDPAAKKDASSEDAARAKKKESSAKDDADSKKDSDKKKSDKKAKDSDEPQATDQTSQETTGKDGKAQDPVEGSKKKNRDKKKKSSDKKDADAKKDSDAKKKDSGSGTTTTAPTTAGGLPTQADPTIPQSLALPTPIGVPNFFIDRFRIPPFLLPIYQAAGIQYGVRWEILAAINEIETDYGRNLNVSTAGAVGWMQFIPSTWKRWGVDANHDGRKDPYNPVDAIFSAARYLKAARADQDVRQAIFAYNHADWYVDSVLMRARLIGGLPADLVGSLTGLTQGRFPVHATARYTDGLTAKDAKRRVGKGQNAAVPVEASASRKSINIFAKAGSPVIAVQDGKIVSMGVTKRLGRFIQLRDVYGNTYTYGHLAKLASLYPVPKVETVSRKQVDKELDLAKRDPRPTAPASAGRQSAGTASGSTTSTASTAKGKAAAATAVSAPPVRKERLFANPLRPNAFAAGGEQQLVSAGLSSPDTFKTYFTGVFGLKRSDVTLKPLKRGSRVIAGTILGRIGRTEQKMASHALFEVRPAGRDAPRIDPKPILDGWKLLESTAVYRAAGTNPFFGANAKNPSIGQVLLMSKEALQRRVLTDSRVKIYECGRRDIRAGGIDRRVLATLEFLAASGLDPTVSTLHCGHSYLTTSGNVSEHSSGNAVDIAAINGIPILGHQGPGSITDITIRRLLTLQGTMKPHQIISLMTFDGADNTLSLPDHADHIHVGFHPLYGANARLGSQLNSVLKPGQWVKLIRRLGKLDNPTVPITPSQYAIKDHVATPAGRAHRGK